MAEDTLQADPAVDTEDKLEQTVEVENAGPARKVLTITVPESRIKDKIESTYSTLTDEAQVPGFRRGKAPRALLERRFADTIKSDVRGQLLSESYTQAVEEHDFDVLGEPDVKDIDDLEVPESGDFVFKVEIEVTPDVELPKFGDIKVTRKPAEVSDEDVDKEIASLRDRHGKMSTAGAEETVKAEDYLMSAVTIYAGEHTDQPGDDVEVLQQQDSSYVLVGGESRDYKGHVLGIVIDDLGKKLDGKKTGDVVFLSRTGPSSHENEKIRDQPITLKITINSIERLEPAPLDEVIQGMGMESEDELKERVREFAQRRAEQEQSADLHKQVREALVEKVELELPEGVTGRQVERTLRRKQMELMYQGQSPEDVEQALAESRQDSEDEAKRQLKEFFILDRASKDLDIDVSENELNSQIAMMAMQQGQRPEKMRQQMMQQGQIEQLYLQIRESKTIEKIIEQATVDGAADPRAAAEEKSEDA